MVFGIIYARYILNTGRSRALFELKLVIKSVKIVQEYTITSAREFCSSLFNPNVQKNTLALPVLFCILYSELF